MTDIPDWILEKDMSNNEERFGGEREDFCVGLLA